MLHESQMVKTGNVIIRNLQCPFEHLNRLVELLGVLVGQAFRVVEFGICGHYLYGQIEVFMGLLDSLQSQVGVAAVE